MTRSRAFNRFHRWTAKQRRRNLRASLPEERLEAFPLPARVRTSGELRCNAWERDQLSDLEEAGLDESVMA
jgi:hypothetical protein